MRIFSGFRVLEEFKKEFSRFQTIQKPLPKLRWTNSDQLHLTVWFYGEIEPETLPNIIAVNQLIAKEIAPFSIAFQKLKLAPKNQNARMIWASFHKNDSFENLVKSHQKRLSAIGLVEKEFTISRPHLTLARFPEGAFNSKDFNLDSNNFPPTLEATELILYESIRTKHGNEYRVIHSETL